MSDTDEWYFIMDGRAHFDMDRACVLVTHDSYEEALEDLPNWPADSVIAQANDKNMLEIVTK